VIETPVLDFAIRLTFWNGNPVGPEAIGSGIMMGRPTGD